MADSWYCSLKSGVWGPIGKEDLDKILKAGYLNKKTWIRREEEKEWIALMDAGIFPPDDIPDSPQKSEEENSFSEPKVEEQTEQPNQAYPAQAEPAEQEQVREAKAPAPIPPIEEEADAEEANPVQPEPVKEKEPEEPKAPAPISPMEEEPVAEAGQVANDQTEPAVARKSEEGMGTLGEKGLQALQSKSLDERKEQARATFNLYRLFWTRVLKSDFSVIKSTKDEAEKLEAGPENVSSPLAQDYASWRRSMLMICILALSVGTILSALKIFLEVTTGDSHWVQKIQSIFIFFLQLGAVALCAMAARNWGELRKSRSQARFAWFIQFLGPFLIFLVPFSLFIFDDFILYQLGMGAIIILAPEIFGLFPGLIRCSLTLKTLLPETSTPGWLGIIIAPTYTLFLAVATIASIQRSEFILGIGFALLAVGMTVVILRAKLLLKATDQEESSKIVKETKRRQMIFQASGVACIAVSVILEIDVNFNEINKLLLFVLTFISNVTLLTVVMSDFMLGMIREGQLQAKAFAGTPMQKSLTERLDDLASCGLTDLEAGEAEFAANFKEKGGFLAKAASARGSKLVEKARQMSNKEDGELKEEESS